MKPLFAGGTCLAFAMAFCIAVSAQSAGQTQPPQAQPPAQQERGETEQQVTIAGCVQREADYRRAQNLGRGGAVGTGAGVGNEFVIVNASATTGTTPGRTETPTGTTGAKPAGTDAYELTGKNESQVEPFVGKRVEIIGTLKRAERGPTGTTGGRTAELPTSRDLKLRELQVTSVRETTGTCPATER